MNPTDRRTFLKMAGVPAVAGALSLDLTKATAIAANTTHGSIRDVEHVVFLMQENRSFDHYFGTLRGVRGYGDPRAVRLPNGDPVWHQPNGGEPLLPFRPDVPDVGEMFLPDPPHGWNDTHAAWNGGRHDQFVPSKGVQTMTYHTRHDLPYQYALADAFTICDSYFCSLLGPTDPNRYHMWTGWVGNDGKGGGPVLANDELGYDWSTYPERLERNGISWKIYQDQGVGLTQAGFWGWTEDPFIGNYGDNSLLYFHQYQNAQPGNPLADKAKTGTEVASLGRTPDRLFDQFRADVRAGALPQVSWIVAPEAYTEHPNWAPDFGAWYVSQVVDILASNPEVWSKMALFITYDEEGGFFDHLVPPTPPRSAADGRSTVPLDNELFPGSSRFSAGPIGLGMRVPLLVVSPWTRGGWVNSQVFDHTSLIRFLEARFAGGNRDLVESNITPWRRAVSGDLTSVFDFRTPNEGRRPQLPSTLGDKPTNLERVPDEPPTPPLVQKVPRQERGVRPARALPYRLHAKGTSTNVQLANSGSVAAVFQVRPVGADPTTYTVGAGRSLDASLSSEDIEVHGPNGFYRQFKGSAPLQVWAAYDERRLQLSLSFRNSGPDRVRLAVEDGYTGRTTRLTLDGNDRITRDWTLRHAGGWYDLLVTLDGDDDFAAHFAGHVENGEDSISDPLMGGLG
jgi:phospholipase C